jgi:hypothetical protein
MPSRRVRESGDIQISDYPQFENASGALGANSQYNRKKVTNIFRDTWWLASK